MEGCLVLKIDASELPNDTQISYKDGKIKLSDSVGNIVNFETNELTILHSKTVVVNSCAYIITAPNVDNLRGFRYYVVDNEIRKEQLENDDNDDNDNDNNKDNCSNCSDDCDDCDDCNNCECDSNCECEE
ncbi:hypothetical protein E24_00414 [Faustovirus]|nr:hypothetical protein PRJ_Fausto_00390 [Faustovirus]AMN83329.1 hypothetical protein E24_00414 [Faustovirus]AMN84313.1 hypothetical protein D5a_00413 [Faustovirus]AMN85299.1 hypothetical protein E23_00414 [Faustovirus]QBR99295.1 ribonucleoside-diphosphate reductase large subunit [Faustovirus mariensis]